MKKFANVLYVVAIFLLIGTVIRTLVYLIIGLPGERIFRIELIIFWSVITVIIIYRNIVAKSKKNKSKF